jgi:hypothetical protein
MKSLVRCYVGAISGVMLGVQLSESNDYNYLIIDLLIVELLIEWDK